MTVLSGGARFGALGLVVFALATAPSVPTVVDVNGDGVLTVACLGDSNTQDGWPTTDTVRWCTRAARERSEWRWRNVGLGGATLCDTLPDNEKWTQLWTARGQLAQVPEADVVVLAFGTNDIKGWGLQATQLVDCAFALRTAAWPRPVYLALVPPMVGPFAKFEPKVRLVNALFGQSFPASNLVDFFTGFGRDLLEKDGEHLNDAGQALRTRRVLDVLR